MNLLFPLAAALVLVHSMGGADKEILPLFKIACGKVIQILLAVVAEHKTGEHIALASGRSAMPLLTNFLCLLVMIAGCVP